MQVATASLDPRFDALARRDKSAGFFYAVTSTGIFCRAGCAARLPKPEHIRFFEAAAQAQAAGFRPCRRCRPGAEEPQAAVVAAACRAIEAAATPPSLKRLAQAAGLSPFYFHRLFKAQTGVTPRAYAAAQRAKRVQAALRQAGSVTQAIYEAGFNASGRFYAAADEILGMAPAAVRAGGASEVIEYAAGMCALGHVLVARTGTGICAISLGDEPAVLHRELAKNFPRAELVAGGEGFETLLAAVIAFAERPGGNFALPLDIRGTAFQLRVWQALREIPAGVTASYTEIAARIGAPDSARAVAGACAANRLAVVVPCHRVKRADGRLAGYRWGVARKAKILAVEAGDDE